MGNRDKTILLNKHNKLRTLIANGKVQGQPRGINLKRMVSDVFFKYNYQ